ncbi:efflux transporter outer membrane subunit [Massilia sp. LjRoot122]|uniref:efflux transporter outer membrane subunit n=1 Tax=Massilia sp. LjRoot122 TaxID=3342257 RepID=UPI003F5093B9
MKKMTRLTPLALALTLAGCMSLAPKYERPAPPVAGAFPELAKPASAPAAQLANETPATIAWQRFFPDARLRGLIEQALSNNRDLRVAIANIEQARAQYRISRADRLPTVGVGISGQRQTTGEDEPISSLYQSGFSVSSFELDLFGRVRNLSQAALAQYLATEEARKSAQISLVSSVASVYLQLLADEELLAITQQTLGTRQESLRLTQLRFDNGVASRFELQQARSLVETALATLAAQQRQRAQDLNLLTLLVGTPVEPVPSGTTLATTELPDLPAGLPSDLLASRPDIRAAEQQLIAANANIGAARANFFPRITLTGSVGSASTELSGLFKSGTYGWTFAPQAILPIFDYGRNTAVLGSARAQRDVAVAQYERSIQTAFREVADALAGQSTFSEQLRAQRAVAEAEADRFNLADLRYRNGAASYLELLDAQRALFQAQQAAVQANLQRLQNQVTLYSVLGGGWTEPGTPVAAR